MTDFPVWSRPSHPHAPETYEPLIDHLIAVENHCICNVPASAKLSTGTPTRPVLQVIAWLHDLGKLTTWFQTNVGNTAVPDRPRNGRRVSDHSFLGGVAAWWVLDRLGYNPYICLVGGIAVARHHNTLPNFSEYFSSQFVDSDRWDTAKIQVENIDAYTESYAKKIFELIESRSGVFSPLESKPDTVSWPDFSAAICDSEYRRDVNQSVTQLTGQKLKRTHRSKSTYDDLLELWGGLKAADTPASAGVSPAREYSLPSPERVDQYVKTSLSPPESAGDTLTQRLNYRREQTRQEVMSNLSETLDTQKTTTEHESQIGRIYTLTLPTGAGKTIAGTQAALRLHADTAQDGGLIYILPYTSLIDQTEEVYRDLFETNRDGSREATPEIVVDHYLADDDDEDETSQDQDGDTDGNIDTTNLWHSDITLSTTVQLWETLYGPSKSQVLKLPQLYESTIIIDEPQSVPTEWFGRIEQLLSTLTDRFGANVLLMSATQPPIRYPTSDTTATTSPVGTDTTGTAGTANASRHSGVTTEQESEPPEIAPSFSLPDNTTVTIDPSLVTDAPLTDDDVATRLYEDIQADVDSILSIHNTINNTNRVTDALTSKLADSGYTFETIHSIYSDLLEQQPTEGKNVDPVDINVYDLLPSPDKIIEAIRATDVDILLTPLTTRHRPCDRSRILQTLTALLDATAESREGTHDDLPQIVALTTQLVEAGVDISFAALYRDIAPYDSLIQAAGRCNRNYEYGPQGGDMTIWQLADNGGGPGTPAEYVYLSGGVNRLNCTKETLLPADAAGCITITESELIDQYDEYKAKLKPKLSLSTPHLNRVEGGPATEASVISTTGDTISVCISRSTVEDKLLSAYRRAQEYYNYDTQDSLRDVLSHIECSLRVDETTPIQSVAHEIDTGLYFIDSSQTQDFYTATGISQSVNDSVS